MANAPNIEMVKVSDLIPNVDNPRVNSSAVPAVAESIRLFGFRVPIVIDKDRGILAGHTRYRAALSLGLKEVPCIDASDLSEEEQAAFSVAENRTSDFAFFDIPKLADMVQDIPEELLGGFELDSLFTSDNVPEDEAKKADVEPEKRAGLDLAPFEKYQYVTIVCRTEFDYVNLLEMLKLEDIQSGYVSGVLKRGSSYGRAMEYPDFLDRIREVKP